MCVGAQSERGASRGGQWGRTRLSVQEMQEMWVRSLGLGDPLEEEMATHSSILAWRISGTEELGGLQSMGPQRVKHDWVTEHAGTQSGRKRKELPLQVMPLETVSHLRADFMTLSLRLVDSYVLSHLSDTWALRYLGINSLVHVTLAIFYDLPYPKNSIISETFRQRLFIPFGIALWGFYTLLTSVNR